MEDSVDRHIARWKGLAPFDERTEGIVTRMQFLVKHMQRAKDHALAEVGLQDFEFETLHWLAGLSGRTTPSALAAELKISPAGMTGRLDTLEKAGLIRRVRTDADRRRVDIELTPEGHALWNRAQEIRGDVDDLMTADLTHAEQDTLLVLLKRMLLKVENRPSDAGQ